MNCPRYRVPRCYWRLCLVITVFTTNTSLDTFQIGNTAVWYQMKLIMFSMLRANIDKLNDEIPYASAKIYFVSVTSTHWNLQIPPFTCEFEIVPEILQNITFITWISLYICFLSMLIEFKTFFNHVMIEWIHWIVVG